MALPSTRLNLSGPVEIQLWIAKLDLPSALIQELGQTLSPEEIRRAERFRFDQHRRRFVAARGILRNLLGRYLGLPAAQLSFSYNPQGKPYLAGLPSSAIPTLFFNLSHSHDLALYAFSKELELGVDLEQIKPQTESLQIASRYFAPGEYATLQALPSEEKMAAFYTFWTLKEAYVKAQGVGLSLAFDQFEVELTPQGGAVLKHRQESGQPWYLLRLSPAPAYVGALAVKGRPQVVNCGQWSE